MQAPPAWIGARELRELGVPGAVWALEEFLSSGAAAVAPQRTIAPAGAGQLLTMPATASDSAGVKLVTIQPENPRRGLPLIHSVYALFDGRSLAPLAIIDGGELTALRTSAVSAVATRYLAREDASRLVVFGSGVQARAHVDAMREADIVCACTTAPEPLFDGGGLPAGAHVNAIGSYQPHTREIDTATVIRSSVFLDDSDAVLAEAGDLRIPIDDGAFDVGGIAGDLRDVVTEGVARRAPEEITLFKSVGVAWQDLAVATAVVRKSVA